MLTTLQYMYFLSIYVVTYNTYLSIYPHTYMGGYESVGTKPTQRDCARVCQSVLIQDSLGVGKKLNATFFSNRNLCSPGTRPAEGESMTTKFSPGPWEVLRTRILEYGVIQRDSDVRVVVGELSEADARLIAAAPEMAEALTWAVAMLDRLREVLPPNAERSFDRGVEGARAALKKAGVL